MSIILDYGLDSRARALLVLALSMEDRTQRKEMDKLHIQKTIKYLEHLQQESRIDFSDFKYGGVSYELQENLETLEECDLIVNVGTARNPKYLLTEEGENAAKELLATRDKEELRQLKFAKLQLNDLGYEETLFFMYMLIPETQKHSVEFARLYEKSDTLVPRLYLKGRINSTTAAKWLNVNEKTFLDSL